MPRVKTEKSAKALKPAAEPWKDKHTLRAVRHVVASSLAARGSLYGDDDMAGVNENSGSRINQKLQQLLNTFTKQFPGAGDIVKKEVARLQNKKRGSDALQNAGSKKLKTEVKAERRSPPARAGPATGHRQPFHDCDGYCNGHWDCECDSDCNCNCDINCDCDCDAEFIRNC